MRILVVDGDTELGELWCKYLERHGGEARLCTSEKSAIAALRFEVFDVLVLDLVIPDTSVLAISDFATYRNPDVAIIVVTASSFFSDGSIFELIPNARGYLHTPVQPDDLAALVEHYGRCEVA